MRSIVFLLAATALIAGCDKPSPPKGQATAAASAEPSLDEAMNSAPVAAKPDSGVDVIGTLDRKHKGEAAPDSSFAEDGKPPVTLAKFAGKPFLLNLWATWCGPCKAEMPTLDAVAAEGKLPVVTVSTDLDGAAKVLPYFAQAKFRALTPYVDPELKLVQALGNPGMPTTILYDAQGKEVWRMTGGMDWTSPTAKDLLAEAN